MRQVFGIEVDESHADRGVLRGMQPCVYLVAYNQGNSEQLRKVEPGRPSDVPLLSDLDLDALECNEAENGKAIAKRSVALNEVTRGLEGRVRPEVE